MSINISRIKEGSPAAAAGIKAGAQLISVNGFAINDVLDYGFRTASGELELVIKDPKSGRETSKTVRKGEYEELGVESESFLMDKQHRCENNCVFCFIDQLPKGLRESLYFKDDDERLSYLFGNYITLTNLGDEEIERIIEMKIEPINISVHTTDKKLRSELMGNRFAGKKLRHLYRLAEAGVPLNCQIVLCRGINDGDALRATLSDLIALAPSVQSIACVPVGLTSFREGLPELTPYDKASSLEVLEIIESANDPLIKSGADRLVFAADEFYLMAGREIPPIGEYGELFQIENGVGMLSLFTDEFETSLACADHMVKKRRAALVTGEAAAPTIERLTRHAKEKLTDIDCEVFAIKNIFFGGCVTVAGLVTATDIIAQLRGRLEGFDVVLIPRDMLRSEGDMFLDSITLEGLANALQKDIRVVTNGVDLLDALTGADM